MRGILCYRERGEATVPVAEPLMSPSHFRNSATRKRTHCGTYRYPLLRIPHDSRMTVYRPDEGVASGLNKEAAGMRGYGPGGASADNTATLK